MEENITTETVTLENQNINIPISYKPLSTWAYFGYALLFKIPIVNFILLIVFSFNNKNINRRNYARSHFLMYLLSFLIMVIIVIAVASVWDEVASQIDTL